MKWMLDIEIKKKNDRMITYEDSILLIGSCFTGNIGGMLKDLKFHTLYNPTGILFDPLSVARHLEDYLTQKTYTVEELMYLNELYHSWQHHSDFSGTNPQQVVEKINEAIQKGHQMLQKATILVITLGSSYAYKWLKEEVFVANCHKAPQKGFQKHLCEIHETQQALTSVLAQIHLLNPQLQVIFTISPVRHIRDGVVENNRSKARLLEAVHSMVEQLPYAHYFPAYEMVIDVLRDYRFYDVDLVHPNYPATQFVFEQFRDSWIEPETRKQMEEVRKIVLAYKHSPQNPDTYAHKNFLTTHGNKARHIQKQLPMIDWSEELAYFDTFSISEEEA